ncbi:MAG: hypothetical protein DMG69_11715 [Acidobacteria bacterium]|nr:MAG: hypothetical protein DMG69_11715 [Acidobacteriota bacterium]
MSLLLAGLLVLLAPVSELAVPEGAAPAVPAAPVVPREADPGPELALPAPQWSAMSVTLLTWNVFCAPELLGLVELELGLGLVWLLLGYEPLEPALVWLLLGYELAALWSLVLGLPVEELEALAGWPVIWTSCPTLLAKSLVLPVSWYTVPVWS